MSLRLAVRITVLLLFATPAAAQLQQGLISGTVLAPDGIPVEDAHVSADVMKGSTVLTRLNADTDPYGQFVFSGLTLGEYRLSAEKTEGGYLSTGPDMFGPKPALTVILTEDIPSATATIRFGPKGAIITGWVLDSSTGDMIAAKLSLWGENSWSMTSINPRFKFRELIPADMPIRLGACADGYKPWFYADSSSPSRPIPVQLASGAELDIVIKLDPMPDKTEDVVCGWHFLIKPTSTVEKHQRDHNSQ